jgi:predicted esterase
VKSFSTYAELNQQMIVHFQNKEYQQALDLISREGAGFPKNRLLVDYWAMCSAARLDDRKLVYQVAEKCLADGLWYGEMMWRMTPSFQALQGDADFERIVAASLALQQKDLSSKEPVPLKYLPDSHSEKSPLFIALHGNQSMASDTLPFWQESVREGYVLAVPQSSQAMFKGAYIWDNLDVSFAEVESSFETIKNEIKFDPNRVILAGHSMGSLIAIQMALTGKLNVRGFIANGPVIPFGDAQDELEKLLPSAQKRGLRTYFIIGKKDVDIASDEIRTFAEKLKSAGIACELETVPGATHDYNPAYDAALARALSFVNP